MLLNPKWEKKIADVEPKMEPWRKLLLDAADLIETRGWVQNLGALGNARCMMAAIFEVGGEPRGIVAEDNPYMLAVGKVLAAGGGMGFNDAPGRTKGEVIAKLREVARA